MTQGPQSAFGSDFKIRNEQEIFLRVYSIEILNQDGSLEVSEWNALTGQKIIPSYLAKNSILHLHGKCILDTKNFPCLIQFSTSDKSFAEQDKFASDFCTSAEM